MSANSHLGAMHENIHLPFLFVEPFVKLQHSPVNSVFEFVKSVSYCVAIQEIFFQDTASPTSESNGIFTINAISDRQYHVKIEVFDIITLQAIITHVFQNGTCAVFIQLSTSINIIDMLCNS